MTIFRTFTDAEKAALKLHGLDTHRPSQLSDAFVLGMRYRNVTPAAVDLFGDGVNRPSGVTEAPHHTKPPSDAPDLPGGAG